MNKYIMIGSLTVVLLVGGGILFLNQQEVDKTDFPGRNDAVIRNEKGEIVSGEDDTEVVTAVGNADSAYSGTILAGKASPYREFTQADYKKAKDSDKLIFLEFYANWCPICRTQEPKLFDGFNALNDPNIVGFRVNYNDPDTDEVEKQLAKEFGVTYQHTHVILKDGKVVSKTNDDLDKDSFIALLENARK